MTREQFEELLPLVQQWIGFTLEFHAREARPVADMNFPRLGNYFSAETLAFAKFVPVANCPVPPLSAMGLEEFSDFEALEPAGITYLDTYFIQSDSQTNESLHFHELVHVLQWRILGPEEFLFRYANGLEEFGYHDSPLEEMAYDHQFRFESSTKSYDVETEVHRALGDGDGPLISRA